MPDPTQAQAPLDPPPVLSAEDVAGIAARAKASESPICHHTGHPRECYAWRAMNAYREVVPRLCASHEALRAEVERLRDIAEDLLKGRTCAVTGGMLHRGPHCVQPWCHPCRAMQALAGGGADR